MTHSDAEAVVAEWLGNYSILADYMNAEERISLARSISLAPRSAAARERERCAKVAEYHANSATELTRGEVSVLRACAGAIRSLGDPNAE